VKLTIRLWRPLSTRSQRERFPVFEKSRYSSSGKAGTGSRDSLRAWGTTEAKAGACAIFPHAARSVIGRPNPAGFGGNSAAISLTRAASISVAAGAGAVVRQSINAPQATSVAGLRACLEKPGRVERGRARVRPMASRVSALSSIVANGHQVIPTFPPPPLFIPYGEFSPVRLETQPGRPVPFRSPSLAAFDAGPAFLSGLAQSPDLSVRGWTHRPLAQRGLSCPRLPSLLRPDAPV
jgi:hypothetical protein